ncbi:HEAT repeat domain-containing protein [Cyanobium sp. PCC 7001]|uniref:HEAT repeat domain-containing protein n=1 Tax=Cyanobium sp. PCC 7001 TaxID=180281 RepID=UPI0005B785FF|nr:HEAT repeat domain-containing protein [Cyanobium sp. PCC 7001]
MPPSSLGAAAAVLALLFWLLRRRRPAVVLRSTDASAVAALNRAQMTESAAADQAERGVRARQDPGSDGRAGDLETAEAWPQPWRPPDLHERGRVLRDLHQRLRGDDATRLTAMRVARLWGDPCVVSLLRRGLRDPDPAVMREAALGLERFRGRTAVPQPADPAPPLPRNVARTL